MTNDTAQSINTYIQWAYTLVYIAALITSARWPKNAARPWIVFSFAALVAESLYFRGFDLAVYSFSDTPRFELWDSCRVLNLVVSGAATVCMIPLIVGLALLRHSIVAPPTLEADVGSDHPQPTSNSRVAQIVLSAVALCCAIAIILAAMPGNDGSETGPPIGQEDEASIADILMKIENADDVASRAVLAMQLEQYGKAAIPQLRQFHARWSKLERDLVQEANASGVPLSHVPDWHKANECAGVSLNVLGKLEHGD